MKGVAPPFMKKRQAGFGFNFQFKFIFLLLTFGACAYSVELDESSGFEDHSHSDGEQKSHVGIQRGSRHSLDNDIFETSSEDKVDTTDSRGESQALSPLSRDEHDSVADSDDLSHEESSSGSLVEASQAEGFGGESSKADGSEDESPFEAPEAQNRIMADRKEAKPLGHQKHHPHSASYHPPGLGHTEHPNAGDTEINSAIKLLKHSSPQQKAVSYLFAFMSVIIVLTLAFWTTAKSLKYGAEILHSIDTLLTTPKERSGDQVQSNSHNPKQQIIRSMISFSLCLCFLYCVKHSLHALALLNVANPDAASAGSGGSWRTLLSPIQLPAESANIPASMRAHITHLNMGEAGHLLDTLATYSPVLAALQVLWALVKALREKKTKAKGIDDFEMSTGLCSRPQGGGYSPVQTTHRQQGPQQSLMHRFAVSRGDCV